MSAHATLVGPRRRHAILGRAELRIARRRVDVQDIVAARLFKR
jgi:hypothetical protein